MKEPRLYGTIMSTSSSTIEPAKQTADYAPPTAVGRWSLNDEKGNTRQAYLFPLLLLINIAIMTDRAIVAGASNEFAAFVSSADDSPAFAKESPDAGIGLIQAAFIFGYSVAVLLSGHYVHKMRWKPLVLSGLCVWWLGVLGSGNARSTGRSTSCSSREWPPGAPRRRSRSWPRRSYRTGGGGGRGCG